MRELPHTRSCFVCGESNPHGLKLRARTDGQLVEAVFVPGAEHMGFRNTVHGGLIATLLDEVMVWACAVRTGRFAYCAEMSVRFQSPLQPGTETLATAQLVANRKNRLFEAKAELREKSGRLIATATGKYLPIQQVTVEEMAADFVGSFEWVFREGGLHAAAFGGEI